jgi:CheY-like chemotaxis protein
MRAERAKFFLEWWRVQGGESCQVQGGALASEAGGADWPYMMSSEPIGPQLAVVVSTAMDSLKTGKPNALPCDSENGARRQARIVIVNDEPSVPELISLMVAFWLPGADILTFTDPEKGWLELSRADPDLLMLDDLMPRLSGREIVQRLIGRETRYPIVVFSSCNETDRWVEGVVSGGFDVELLHMPCTAEDLKSLLARHLHSAPA